MALRDSIPAQTILDANGGGEASITVRSEFLVEHTRVSTSTTVNQPKALLRLNGEDFEGTRSGGTGDVSDTRHLMLPNDTLTCVWTGGDPGATATLRIRGLAYPPGQGIKAVS